MAKKKLLPIKTTKQYANGGMINDLTMRRYGLNDKEYSDMLSGNYEFNYSQEEYDRVMQLINDMQARESKMDKSQQTLTAIGSTAGGIVGGIAGSVVPGLGTTLGATIGTAVGGLAGKGNELAQDYGFSEFKKSTGYNDIMNNYETNFAKYNQDKSELNNKGINIQGFYANGGKLQPIAENVQLVQGAKHESGGVQLGNNEVEGGEVINEDKVYSDRLIAMGNKTYAEVAEKLAKKKGKFDSKLMALNEADRNTATRMSNNIDQDLERLYDDQELKKVIDGINSGTMMANGGAMGGDPSADAISLVLMNRNKGLDFVDRAFDPNRKSIDNGDGTFSTHSMMWGEDDKGQAYMYPSVVNKDGSLVRLSDDEAMNYAFENKQAIKVPNQYAKYISSTGYKKATGMLANGGLLDGDPTTIAKQYYPNFDQLPLDAQQDILGELNTNDNFVDINDNTFGVGTPNITVTPNKAFESKGVIPMDKMEVTTLPTLGVNNTQLPSSSTPIANNLLSINNDYPYLSKEIASALPNNTKLDNSQEFSLEAIQEVEAADISPTDKKTILDGIKSGNIDYGELAANALPLVDNLINAGLIASTPNVPKPSLQGNINLRKKVNVQPQLSAIDDATRAYIGSTKANTVSSSTANARQLAALGQASKNKLDVLASQAATEAELTNKETLLNANIEANNLEKIDKYKMLETQRDAGILEDKAANAKNLTEDFKYMIERKDLNEYQKTQLTLDMATKLDTTAFRGLIDMDFMQKQLKTDTNMAQGMVNMLYERGMPDDLKYAEKIMALNSNVSKPTGK